MVIRFSTADRGTYSFGVYLVAYSSPTIRNSAITGTTNSIFNDSFRFAKVADTALGGAVGGTGVFTCIGVYDTAFARLGTSCV